MSLASLGIQLGSGSDAIGAAGALANVGAVAVAAGVGVAASGVAAGLDSEFAAVQANRQMAETKQVLSRIGCITLSQPSKRWLTHEDARES
jgi:hypothetical protein